MDLKNFVSESLYQIIAGIKDAQDKVAEVKVETEPKFNAPYVVPMPASDHDKKLYDVHFDVAVTVSDGISAQGGGGLSVLGLTIGGNGKSEQNSSSVSRIKFTIPVSYPYMIKQHY